MIPNCYTISYYRNSRFDDRYNKSVERNVKPDVCPFSRGRKYPNAKRK